MTTVNSNIKPHSSKKWHGTWPAECDICAVTLSEQDSFIDGRLAMGSWALLCPGCHIRLGVGLGTGKGQRYDSKTLIKLLASQPTRG